MRYSNLLRKGDDKLEKILASIDTLSNWTGKGASFLILATIAVIIPEVIARYAFNHSFLFAHDLVWFLCGTLYMIGGAYTLLREGHVKVDIIYAKFPPRTRAILDVITFFVFALFVGFLIWQGIRGFLTSFKAWELTVTPWGGPVWFLRLMIPTGAFLILLQGLKKFVVDLKIIKGSKHAS